MERWCLPDQLIEAILWHHCPEDGSGSILCACVYLADILAKTKGLGFDGDDKISGLQELVTETIGLTEIEIESILEIELDRIWQSFASFVQIIEGKGV